MEHLFHSTIGILIVVGYFLTWLLIPWVLLKRRVDESAAVAWLIAIIFVPFLGAFLCVLMGNMRWEKQSARKREASQEIHQQVVGHHQDSQISPEHWDAWRRWLA